MTFTKTVITIVCPMRVSGAVRPNKGFPNFLKAEMETMRKRDTTFWQKGNVLLFIWKDKGEVRMISTVHGNYKAQTGKKNNKTREDVSKPTCEIEYNQHMKGVDWGDQYLSYYSIF
jgi:hypothetical protein